MRTYELIPKDGRKSFYGKAYVNESNGVETLASFCAPIIERKSDGALNRLWNGWTATTGRHIAAFCGLSKESVHGFISRICGKYWLAAAAAVDSDSTPQTKFNQITATMTNYEYYKEKFAELGESDLVNLYRAYQREIGDEEEWCDFDDEFFSLFFDGNTMEAVRAWHFGSDNNSWNDEFIHFNAYGNLETASAYEVAKEAEDMMDEIYEYPDLWMEYIEAPDEDEDED